MFDQTFVDPGREKGKPISLALSLLVQCAVVALLILLSLVYTQTIPVAQVRSLLLAPRAPVAVVRETRQVRSTQTVSPIRNKLVLLTPIPVSFHYTLPSQVGPAPNVASPIDTYGDSGPGLPFGAVTDVGGPPPPSPPKSRPASHASPSTERISAGVAAANLVHKITPVYPRLAVAARIQGTVHFHALISKEGHIQELQVLSGHPLLIGAAREAVLQWRYRPTLLNGTPVDVVTDIEVHFTLAN